MSDTEQSKATEQFKKLSAHAAEAQTKIKESAATTRDTLSKQVDEARKAAEVHSAELKGRIGKENEKIADRASDGWTGVQDSWHKLTSRAHGRVADRQAEHDAKHAEHHAERAERDAMYAVDFAYATLEEAEYAILDAMLARMDADQAALATA